MLDLSRLHQSQRFPSGGSPIQRTADELLQFGQIPISADRGQWSVFVMQDGRAHLVPVRVGRMNEKRAQIVEGLKAGASVILHPSEKIDDGVAVRLRAGVS